MVAVVWQCWKLAGETCTFEEIHQMDTFTNITSLCLMALSIICLIPVPVVLVIIIPATIGVVAVVAL